MASLQDSRRGLLFTALTMICMTTHAKTSNIFTLVDVDLTDSLITEWSARSEVDCARQCSSLPACARAVFSKDTGQCQGHRWTMECGGDGSYRAVVWERDAEKPVTNLAYGKPTAQSSDNGNYVSSLAVDGSTTGGCSCTDGNASPPHWWQVDLGDSYSVVSVTINNTARPHHGQPEDFDIHVYTEDPQTQPAAGASLCHHQDSETDPLAVLQCGPTTAPGRYLRITSVSGRIRVCEVAVSACPVFT